MNTARWKTKNRGKLISNTHYFYRRGWRGINVEPNPDSICDFKSARRRDLNLQVGVSNYAGRLTYYLFDEPALNTFDGALVKSRLADTPYKVVGTIEIPVERLDSILGKYLPSNMEIDFLSIDVEGLDFAVLKSNDWRLYRPKFVLVEALGMSLEDVLRGEMFHFMRGQGYELFAKTFNTLIFRERKDDGTGSDKNTGAVTMAVQADQNSPSV
jgi:FkbM family methyltransferase